jgi:hypothetical protein
MNKRGNASCPFSLERPIFRKYTLIYIMSNYWS